MSRSGMEAIARRTQDEICAAISALDGQAFEETAWTREGGGGGRSRVLQEGNVFEKAGCGVSVVHGELSASAAASMRPGKPVPSDLRFYACGVSLVIHPRNPFCPTFHANFRYMEVGGEGWFGGGADLTPSYLFEEDASHFHRTLRAPCDRHDPAYWPRFKAWCDDYFLITHRGERRGVGGFFFDDLPNAEAFVDDCAAALVPAYLPIAARRKDHPFDDSHKRWQQLRRGRYVEFNLVYDRGTTFGLKTNARIDAVLMSLPLTARWEVGHEPEPGSEEHRLLDVLQVPRDWA